VWTKGSTAHADRAGEDNIGSERYLSKVSLVPGAERGNRPGRPEIDMEMNLLEMRWRTGRWFDIGDYGVWKQDLRL